MGETKLGDDTVSTSGELPALGSKVPPFSLTRQNLSEATLVALMSATWHLVYSI